MAKVMEFFIYQNFRGNFYPKIEKLFRNSLKAISTHIRKEHNENYHIFNLSEREYGEENAFEGKVTYVNWKDHHNPTILVLAETCA
jgi:hypothetical protein